MAHKATSWFVTKNGRRFSFAVACSTSIAIFSGYTLPNTWFLNEYKEIVHLYKSGFPVRVPAIVENRFNTAINLLEIPETERKRIKPFTVFAFDVYNCGTTYSKFGALVGIPINFEFNNVESINKADIRVFNEPVDWTKTESQQLLSSLILSENAQLYAIAREISVLNSPKLILDTLYATSVFVFMYGFGNYVNRKYNLYVRPTSMRVAMYSLITIFGFGMYAFLTDFTQNYFDKKIDNDLWEQNEIFAEGGKEFYEKIMQRNVSLRKLMGSYGERKFTALGNENYIIRQKTPLGVRRDFFASKVQKTNQMFVV